MKHFKDLNIKTILTSFIGEKVRINKILNTEIIVHDYKIKESEKKPGTKYLTLQISRKGEKEVIFTGSKILMNMIEQVSKENFPFTTTIIQEDQMFQFT
ncbi:hypothetical protein CEY12_06050 [Chryseobacterium sp. T16E-39]|uniref:hypothetical protein n=1 Tax=Chryseobacterium sp. T16E-39 TaxID=2015076 RepID=UPI000B5B2D5D|nr:hypothetical protein [Chryseobacterium sp. T16E-39]ASK29692.1 hypothetical protein CEY12_06050 [Chryseobacterium sp. T16E-39]